MKTHFQLFPVCILLLATPVLWADSVEMNVVAGDRASFGAAQKWMQKLSSVRGARIRSDQKRSARPEAKWIGSTLHVTAVIGSGDQLMLPNQKFSLREVGQISQWIERQRKSHNTNPKDERNERFGLSSRELEQAHEMLKKEVPFSTKDKSAKDVLRQIVRTTGLPVKMSAADFRRMPASKLNNEWKGYSAGTTLAALLRNAECIMIPESEGGRIQLQVQREQSGKEAWPAGWESKLKKDDLIPKILDRLPIEIYDTPIADVMKAIEGRIETKILFDEGLLSASGVDLETVKVDIPATKTFYSKVIRLAAFKANMTAEVRVDETGKPFYWIAPVVKRSR